MDRHDVPPGTTGEQVTEAHNNDLKFQTKHGCKCMTYWYDEERSAAFCLFDAPSKNAVKELHQQAHGLMPNQIIEVDLEVVRSFLGRIEDPDSDNETVGTAFRAVMFTDLKDSTKFTQEFGDSKACLLYTSPSPRDQRGSRMPSSA